MKHKIIVALRRTYEAVVEVESNATTAEGAYEELRKAIEDRGGAIETIEFKAEHGCLAYEHGLEYSHALSPQRWEDHYKQLLAVASPSDSIWLDLTSDPKG